MATLIAGLFVIVLGILGLIKWASEFILVLKGIIPVVLILAGVITVLIKTIKSL